jgi:hypothetical protein
MASVHSRRVRGALAFYDTHRMRLVDAIGQDVFKYELLAPDLNADATDPTGWTSTVVEAGSGTTEFTPNNTAGRVGTITCAANENDGGSYQLLGENFELTSDQDLYVGAKLQIDDADQTDLFFGLAVTDTALLGGVADGVYFESVDGSALISTVTEKDSSETQNDSAGTITDATDILLELYFDGSSVYFFIDGSQVNVHTANIPDDEALRVSIEFLTGEAVANTCNVAWLRAIQIGR